MAEQSPQEPVEQQEPLVPLALRLLPWLSGRRQRRVEPAPPPPDPTTLKPRGFQRLRPAWWVALILAVAGILYSFYQPHQTMRRLDGTRLEVIRATRNASMKINAGGTRTEQQLVVRYWSDKKGLEQMRDEARGLATVFYPVANANHLDILVLEPSWPAFTRAFPVLTYSANVRFFKDQTGFWREDPIR